MKIGIVLGTRPEIIKLCSIIRELESRDEDYFIIHTNQHYSENMDKVFFDDLNLPGPRYNLDVGSGNHGKQTGIMLQKIEEILLDEKPDVVLIEGDTNSVLAGALASVKLHIKVGHIEAGLRSYDKRMPEEHNRIMTDHISTFLFAPTQLQKKILLKEGIPEENIYVVGNTIVDAVISNKDLVDDNKIMGKYGLKKEKYVLVTSHRPENVDNKENLNNIITSIEEINKKYRLTSIFPMHPRTKKMLETFNIKIPVSIKIVDPLNYLDFIGLMKNAKVIMTDSGGVQEEACIIGVPTVTLRISTERPETVEVGANIISGLTRQGIINAFEKAIELERGWKNPFGDGKTGERIIDILSKKYPSISKHTDMEND